MFFAFVYFAEIKLECKTRRSLGHGSVVKVVLSDNIVPVSHHAHIVPSGWMGIHAHPTKHVETDGNICPFHLPGCLSKYVHPSSQVDLANMLIPFWMSKYVHPTSQVDWANMPKYAHPTYHVGWANMLILPPKFVEQMCPSYVLPLMLDEQIFSSHLSPPRLDEQKYPHHLLWTNK